MLFDHELLQMQLLEILSFDDDAVTMKTRARPFYALSLRSDGETEIVLQNGETVHLVGRDLALFHPNLSYNRFSHHDRRIVFHFCLVHPNTEMDYESSPIEILHDFRYDILQPLFEEADRIWHEQKPGCYYQCTAILYQIFAEIQKHRHTEMRETSALISRALAYMDEHYSEHELNVSAIAAYLHISTNHLRRCFLHDLGISPKAHLTSLRMARAQALLNSGYYSVASIAKQSGFRDSKNFATAYKKHFGYPPSEQKYEDFC